MGAALHTENYLPGLKQRVRLQRRLGNVEPSLPGVPSDLRRSSTINLHRAPPRRSTRCSERAECRGHREQLSGVLRIAYDRSAYQQDIVDSIGVIRLAKPTRRKPFESSVQRGGGNSFNNFDHAGHDNPNHQDRYVGYNNDNAPDHVQSRRI